MNYLHKHILHYACIPLVACITYRIISPGFTTANTGLAGTAEALSTTPADYSHERKYA